MHLRDIPQSIRITAVIFAAALLALGLFSLRKARRAVPPPVRPSAARPPVARVPLGMIAIVIDDVGYNTRILEAVKMMRYPLTFSILPDTTFASRVALSLHEQGFETIIHMPMEPLEPQPLEPNTIMAIMPPDRIREIVAGDIGRFPFVKGVNNHMGSRITGDTRALDAVFSELKRHRLYFLDSYVTPASAAAGLASKDGIRFVRRDVFLDNSADPASIIKQLERVKARARQNGSAVAIGHDRKATLEVLREQLPVLVRQGYRLVFVSELAH